jgi:hypothetical protein
MPKLRLLAAATTLSLVLAGCHSYPRNSDIRFTMVAHNDSVEVTCRNSSSDKCHFAFDTQPNPSVVTVASGSTITVPQVPVGTKYCAEPHNLSLGSCAKETVAFNRQNVEKRSKDDHPVSN